MVASSCSDLRNALSCRVEGGYARPDVCRSARRGRWPVLGSVDALCTQAVSCCIREASSRTAQCSTPLPSTTRMMCICL
jgi:hypothetical protein